MVTTKIKTRIQLKNDIEENWNEATGFIPKKGEFIIYNPSDGSHNNYRFKMGDDIQPVTKLPFATIDVECLPNSNANEGNYGPSSATDLSFGSNFNIPNFTLDVKGRVINASNIIMTLPSLSYDSFVTSGTKIGTLTINQEVHDIYVPKLTGNYLPLTGGTLTGSLNMGTATEGEKIIKFYATRAAEGTGNWSNNFLGFYDASGKKIFNYGLTGTSTNINYGYIGIGNYNSDVNLKIAPNGTVTAKQFSGPLLGNASSAAMLQTSRIISLDGDVTGSISFNGSEDKTIIATVKNNSHSHSLSTLTRGEGNWAGMVNSIDYGLFNSTRACRTAFTPADAIQIEYFNGIEWIDYGATEYEKRSLFALNKEVKVRLGSKTENVTATVGEALRITIEPKDRNATVDTFYCMFINYGHTCSCTIETSTLGAKDTFTILKEDVRINGWPGPNEITFPTQKYGGSSSQINNSYKYRFTFKIIKVNNDHLSSLPEVFDLRLYGPSISKASNNMSITDYIYSWDIDQNVTFPAKVTATSFEGNATTATELQTARTISISSAASSLAPSFNGSSDITLAIPATMTGFSSITSATFVGDLSGKATSADKLTTNAGDANTPVYFKNGKPVAITSINVAAANTAVKLQTSRKINGTSFDGTADITTSFWGPSRNLNLSGDVVGTINVNGSKDVNANIIRRGCVVGAADSIANPWYKFASITIDKSYNDQNITFSVHGDYTHRAANKKGILHAHIRTKNSGILENCDLTWLIASSEINVNDFIIAASPTTPIVVELWVKVSLVYTTYRFDVMAEGSRTNRENRWILYNNTTNGSADVTSGYTKITSSLNTIINNVSTANKLSTMSKLSIRSSAGTTGTNFDGSANATLIVPTTMTGFSSITSTTFVGNLSGTATSAGKLQTSRAINGTNFNGSSDITTTNWGSYRTLTIGNKEMMVNGSDNYSWPLHDILHMSNLITDSPWTMMTPGVYGVASENGQLFTGEGNPGFKNNEGDLYPYGQLIVSRVKDHGIAQFYISHQASSLDPNYTNQGIRFRSGYHNDYLSTWRTILDSANYIHYFNGENITGIVPLAHGGTGASSKKGAKSNLGITYGYALPETGSEGDIFFLIT